MNKNDDKNIFRSLYGDIDRITNDRVPEWRQKPCVRIRHRWNQPEHNETAISPWPRPAHDEIESAAPSTYRANGIQDKQIKKLRRGQIKPQASIDLHGMTRITALQKLQTFIMECLSSRIQCIHIIHGKGLQSDDGKAVLKPSVAIWLKQIPAVLAYCPAQSRDGGDGALYVLLKNK